VTSSAPAPAKASPPPPKAAPLPPPVQPKPAATSSSSTRTPAAKKAADNDDAGFEVVDEPKAKKRVAADDDDDDEPRKKKRRDDDDEDKASRKKKNRDDDDDDDEPRKKKRRDDDDDEPRKKKKSRRYEDDEEDWELTSKRTVGHGKARIGLMLVTISSWLYFSLYALLSLGVLFMLISLLGAGDTPSAVRSGPNTNTFSGKQSASLMLDLIEGIVVLIGLIGLANWILSLIGFSICIAGPGRTRAISIITTCVAAVHLILVLLSYLIASESLAGIGKISQIESFTLLIFATTQPFLDTFLPALIYGSRGITGEYIVVILTGVAEVVRLFFSFLTIRTMAGEGKNNKVYERAQVGIVSAAIVIGGGILLMLLVIVLIAEIKFRSLKTAATLGLGSFFIVCLAYTVLLTIPAITAMGARSSLGQRSR
jgi:hypothetical protein